MHPCKVRTVFIHINGTVLKTLSCFLFFHSALCSLCLTVCAASFIATTVLRDCLDYLCPLTHQPCCHTYSCAYPVDWHENFSGELWDHRAYVSLVNYVPPHCSPVWLRGSYPSHLITMWPLTTSPAPSPATSIRNSCHLMYSLIHWKWVFWRWSSPTLTFYIRTLGSREGT